MAYRAPEPARALRLDGVTRQFSRRLPPAVAASLELAEGDLLALLGPSGCGKTTLLRLIAGFEQPQQGTIEISGLTVAGAGCWVPPEQRGVGMVFQDYALFPHLTVFDNVAFGLQTGRQSGTLLQKTVLDAIDRVGLRGLESRYPHQLSGGQQQRVALARALAPRPLLVLLDEPLSNLDIQVRLHLRQELRRILKSAGTTAIFVTHDQEEALSIADAIAVMRAGQIEQIGTPEQIYQMPATRFVAEFVTQANLLPAQRQRGVWQSEIGAFPAEPVQPQVPGLDQGLLLLRQEDLALQADPTSPIVIVDRQFLGREYRYCLKMDSGQQLIARTPVTVAIPVGTGVKITATAVRQVFACEPIN